MDLGINMSTGSALILAPLVQVAWAEGKVTDKERETVLRLAAGRGVEKGSPAEAQLLAWLDRRPDDAVFQAAIQVIKAGLSHLPSNEREERIAEMVQACWEVSRHQAVSQRRWECGAAFSTEARSVFDVRPQRSPEPVDRGGGRRRTRIDGGSAMSARSSSGRVCSPPIPTSTPRRRWRRWRFWRRSTVTGAS